MKKLTGGVLVVAGIVGSLLLGAGVTDADLNVDVIMEDEEVLVSNVGDGQEYAYEIVSIEGKEVNGIPLNKASKTNCGLLIYKEEIGFDVKVGDKIVVVWGEYEDEFAFVDRAVQAENGEYMSRKEYCMQRFTNKLYSLKSNLQNPLY